MRHTSVAGLGAVVLTLAWLASATAQSPAGRTAQERGKVVYESHCAICHGVDGRAETAAGRLLNPRPRNFADAVEMSRVTVDRIYHAIKEGRAGTAMAPWSQVLSEGQIGDVMDYIQALARQTPAALSSEQLSLEVGRRIYERECVLCHGKDGRAQTETARVLRPRPHDLADPIEMARIDDGRMYAAVKLGRRGTGMAGWGELLSPAEIIDLMRYVRTLEQPLPRGMTPAALDVAVGKKIYAEHCAACHGDRGDGQTPLGQSLVPRPPDLARALSSPAKTDRQLAEAIADGRRGTSMAPWRGILNSEDIRRLLAFMRQTLPQRP